MFTIKNIFIANEITYIFILFYLFLALKKNTNKRTIKLFFNFILFYAIGYILFILRNQIPDFISIVVANTLFAAGSLNLYMASKDIVNLDSRWKSRYIIPILIIFSSHIIFTYIHFSTNIRIIIFNIFIAIYTLLGALIFKKYPSEKYHFFDKITSMLFFSGSIIFIFIVLRTIEIRFNSYYLNNFDFMIFLPNIYMFVVNIWIVAAVSYRFKD